MSDFGFTKAGWDDYRYWIATDRRVLKKINDLLEDIRRNGALEGIGKPEALKNNLTGLYSRRIDEANRLVYSFHEGEIEVVQCRGHY